MKTISGRSFLKRTAARLAEVSWGIRNLAQRSEPIPALVIGSGFGGAIAALRLAQAGIQTVVLERGIRWPITPAQDTFATFEKPDGRAAWLSTKSVGIAPYLPIDKFTGVLEQFKFDHLYVLTGAGVGGSSLVYNGITLQPRREMFERVFPREIDFDEMDQVYYPRVLSVLHASQIPDDILATPFYSSTRVNLQQAKNAGFFSGKFAPTNVDWDIVRQEIAGTRRPSAIAGESWYGLNSGAKNSVDHNYIPMAEATGKVEILTLHVVTDIIAHPWLGLFEVRSNVIDTNGNVLRTETFSCERLFMAAGSMGTSSLLVRAKAKGTLPGLSSSVGQGWGTNGDFIMVRAGLGDNNAGSGGPAGHFLIEDTKNAFGPTNAMELVTHKNIAQPGFSLYLGLGLAPAAGTFTFDATTDSVKLSWPDPKDPKLATFISSANSLISSFNGANPGSQTAYYDPTLTAHPLGGATLGRVCDLYGRVMGYPGLYVVDGSFVPGGSVGGVTPAFTIAALAERNIEKIIATDILGGTAPKKS